MNTENRILKRRQLIFHLQVLNRDSGESLGRVVDITEDGMMLMLPAPVEVGHVYPCRMLLPDGQTLDFDATNRWVKRGVNPDYFDAGFWFDGLSDDDERAILGLIERYKMS
jgi:hypothetical protein